MPLEQPHLAKPEDASANRALSTGVTMAGSRWTVIRGDAADSIRSLEAKSFDSVITSPPYFWLRDYGVNGQIGREESVQAYVDAMLEVTGEIHRVLKKEGVFFLNMGDTYYSGKGESQGVDTKNRARRFGLRAVDKGGGMGLGLRGKTLIGIPWRLAIAMTQAGWILRSSIIWHRAQSLMESVEDRPRRSYEYLFMFVKSRKYYFNRAGVRREWEEDLWSIVTRPKATRGLKTATFPDELVERCLSIGCPLGGKVLDPFAGSGTTLRVAVKSGRDATGIDLNPNFFGYMASELSTAGR